MGKDNAPYDYACQAYGQAHMAQAQPGTQNHFMTNEEEVAPGPVDVAIGRALAKLRKQAGLTQEQLAERFKLCA